jgi:hypothetical protein
MTLPSPTDRFAIVQVRHGPAPDDAIVVGPLTEVFEYIPQSAARQDAVEELEKARFTADQIASMQEKTRAVQATMLADSVKHLSARLDSLLQRRDAEARARAKAEEEEEQQRIQAELDALPDPDAPDARRTRGRRRTAHTAGEGRTRARPR